MNKHFDHKNSHHNTLEFRSIIFLSKQYGIELGITKYLYILHHIILHE